jgi:hypothetical protein
VAIYLHTSSFLTILLFSVLPHMAGKRAACSKSNKAKAFPGRLRQLRPATCSCNTLGGIRLERDDAGILLADRDSRGNLPSTEPYIHVEPAA